MRHFWAVWIAVFIVGSALEMQAQTFRYVKAGGTGNGSSWANASGDLQLMINNSAAGDEIWVAEGTYKPVYTADGYFALTSTYPTTDGGCDNAFVLKADVKIYGGFKGDGSETSIADRAGGASILSGDIDRTPGMSTGDAYHVVISAGNVGTATLDGFTITGGRSFVFYVGLMPPFIMVNLKNVHVGAGGGMCNVNSSPTLTNLTIIGNSAFGGGGMSNDNSSPTLTNVTISGNSAGTSGGGGMSNSNSSPTLTNVTISGNSAGFGGGIYNMYSSPTLTNVTISGNSAGTGGGGGMSNSNSSPTLTNVTISGNSAGTGGGMFNKSYYSSSPPRIRNSIIWGNTAVSGSSVENDNSTPTYTYSIVEGSSGGWGSFGTNGGNNLDSDPLFVNPVAASSAPTSTGDYRLQAGSPAINNGYNALIPAGITTDLDGNPRIANGTVDMGAYEYAGVTTPTYAVTVVGGTGSGNYAENETVNIVALIPSGQGFVNWTASPAVTFADDSNPRTTFTMPASAVTVTAHFGPRLPEITITTQPAPATTFTEGGISGSLSVAATVTQGASLIYRWYQNTTNSNTGGTAIADAMSSSYTIPATLTAGTYYYYCTVRATGGALQVNSDVAVVTVNAPASSVPVPVTSITVTSAGNATTITTQGGTLQMQTLVLPDNATDKTVTWTVIPGTGGATISTGGLLTALANGTVTVRATASDGSGVYGERFITISGQTPPATPVTSITVTGAGGVSTITTNGGTLQMLAAIQPATATIQSVTWTATPGTGSATITTGGLLTAATNGTVTVTATANDGSGVSGSLTVTLSGQPIPPFAIFASALTPFGSLQTPYVQPAVQIVTVINTGTNPVTLAQPTATNYDIGTLSTTTLAANSATATFTVQPKAGLPAGNHDEIITVTGNSGAVSTAVSVSFTVTAATVPPNITTLSLPPGTVGTAYNLSLESTGDAPIGWTVTGGNLPDGLNMSDAGAITGTPTLAGIFNFTVQASNGAGVYTRAYTVTITDPTANEAITQARLTVWIHHGVLHISGLTPGQSCRVYNILGTLVASPNPSDGGEFELPLPGRGVYIVSDGKNIVKVNN